MQTPHSIQMMPDPHLPSRGFRNLRENGAIRGFCVTVFSPYYRGVYLSLIEGFDVTVDGVLHDTRALQCRISGTAYSMDELAVATTKRWQWDEPAVLEFAHPGGLAMGLHRLQVALRLRISYMPTRPTVFELAAHLPLVH